MRGVKILTGIMSLEAWLEAGDEHRLGEIEFARHLLHALVAEPVGPSTTASGLPPSGSAVKTSSV